MKKNIFLVFLFILFFGCKSDSEKNVENQKNNKESEMIFDKEKWKIKDGKDYLFRDKMINDVLYNDTIRMLNKEQLLIQLGNPDYIREGHLYYRIHETRIAYWTLKTKTMVIKLKGNSSVEWIKIHE